MRALALSLYSLEPSGFVSREHVRSLVRTFAIYKHTMYEPGPEQSVYVLTVGFVIRIHRKTPFSQGMVQIIKVRF